MADFSHLQDFLHPVSKAFLNDDQEYDPFQVGGVIDAYEDDHHPDIDAADIILLGVGEERGSESGKTDTHGPDAIRREFFRLYNWHRDIKLADVGNLLPGAFLADAYAAMKTVVAELLAANKTVIILGGSHDLTYPQYKAYASQQLIIEATVADALIDLKEDSSIRSERFLMDILTEQPNYLRHYNHIGFQSYFVHPRMLETLDKLRFDCYRLGRIRENMEEAEPVLRHSDLFSLDINIIRHTDAPANQLSPNGFSGEEACSLARYAGMSSRLSSFGIYGYRPEKDKEHLTARQISQMMWYFMDGRAVKNKEALLDDRDAFWEFHIAFSDIETVFLKSKKTGRWWMQLPDREFVPCAYNDYLMASNNEMPERWLRHQERL
ncbi:Arginase family enzyme [Chitinophaga ginsengisegetis]|uniref:Arginase family enzyme n=1 Tax=Chitinophaga ginsengisegetis TaxID=393003 RepID=A0A1T5P6W6_9BACT|nr:formimidoylglutamase [Chitinophaga ginsengisegetis]MDR6566167.1 arginase family enzyme [Chitinophaga ginsengisegetis]MDR6645897.1 arginase family enzyme [Chitinophaga ginsengisegetis]MDR6651511.1 arginase family enzyme [Chitinophaga ginsengisegetis]SKD08293.1 Arginase family enzyme [Chitinophaga ginsengisegetis]